MIKVFEQETRDGVGEIVAAKASVNYSSVARMIKEPNKDFNLNMATIKEAIASANQDQIDLFYLDTILVSTGWNKNDDVFLPDQAWAARNTPEDKQFNYMHDEKDIIGHITGSYVVDPQGNLIDSSQETAPAEFDIVAESVLYKHWNDAELKERMEKIIAEIQKDEWYVSMECLFSGFNYAMVSPDGKNILLERNEATASLTKHLRIYGGEGEYQGYKIGRALSGISFSGKGLVNKPANPRSIILRSKAFDLSEQDFTEKTIFTKGENQMSDVLEKQVDRLEKELATAQETIAKVTKEAEEARAKEVEKVIAEKDEAIANMNKKYEAVSKEIESLKAALEEKTKELVEAQEAVQAAEQKEKVTARVTRLVKAGFEEAEAQESVELYEALDDEKFEKVAAKYEGFKKKEDEDKKKEAEAAKDEDDKKKKKKEAEAKKDDDKKDDKKDAEASEETFEETKAEDVVTDSEEDDLDSAKAEVSGWMDKMFGTEENKTQSK